MTRRYLRLRDGREMWEDDDRIALLGNTRDKVGDTVVVWLKDDIGGVAPLWQLAVCENPPRDLLAEVAKAIDDEVMGFDTRPYGDNRSGIKGHLIPTGQFAVDSDPHGIDQHAPGAKLDAEKPRVGLVMDGFALALLEVAKVGTYGARKYSDNGWMSVKDGQARYRDAKLRHALQASYEERDAESGLLHKAQECWNCLAELELYMREGHR